MQLFSCFKRCRMWLSKHWKMLLHFLSANPNLFWIKLQNLYQQTEPMIQPSLWLLYTVTFTFLREGAASLFSSCLKAVSFITEVCVKPVSHPSSQELQPLHVNGAWQGKGFTRARNVMSGIPSTLAKCLQSGS